jgi:predicted nucleotidyltransferase component of viral defense system
MNLHLHKEDFDDLITLTAAFVGIPQNAVRRDYFIVLMMQNLEKSPYADLCVFKGGTSLSKCYPDSINRFSEDIDISYIPKNEITDRQYDKDLKQIEQMIIGDASSKKIDSERNNRNKSSYVWHEEMNKEQSRIKLEIGSSVKPEPYDKRNLSTYIQDYLIAKSMENMVDEFDLRQVSINTLRIERTFLDKIFAVKRHAICGTLGQKVRHIYDVYQLLRRKEILDFLENREELKRLVRITKDTDSFYLGKRGLAEDYNLVEPYDFSGWREKFAPDIRARFESLHVDLIYSGIKHHFDDAVYSFERIDSIFKEIDE